MQLPSEIHTEAHRTYDQAGARSNTTCGDSEIAHFANAMAQRDLPLIILAPGKTQGADKLLAWLVGDHEYSYARERYLCLAQDSISKGLLDRSLDGAQFSIYTDKSEPSKILELYTFSFHYRIGKVGDRRLMGLTPLGRGDGTITTISVRSGMVNVINQLHDFQQQLPALPSKWCGTNRLTKCANAIWKEERYLMCHLFQSSHAPRHYQPPGFHSCTDTSMAIIENGLWNMKQRSFGEIDSGTHRYQISSTLFLEVSLIGLACA